MSQAGYSDIAVLERGGRIPFRYSAAWDLNKIVRAEYEDLFYTDLALVSPDQDCKGHLGSTLALAYRKPSKRRKHHYLDPTIVEQATS